MNGFGPIGNAGVGGGGVVITSNGGADENTCGVDTLQPLDSGSVNSDSVPGTSE